MMTNSSAGIWMNGCGKPKSFPNEKGHASPAWPFLVLGWHLLPGGGLGTCMFRRDWIDHIAAQFEPGFEKIRFYADCLGHSFAGRFGLAIVFIDQRKQIVGAGTTQNPTRIQFCICKCGEMLRQFLRLLMPSQPFQRQYHIKIVAVPAVTVAGQLVKAAQSMLI